jgi:heme exporter protein D
MDRQYNDQNKHGQAIQRPKELPVHVSFGRYIVCPFFFWSLYCLSMLLLVVELSVHVSLRPKEKWTDNITTKRNMDRQYNDQKKHGQAIQRPKETWTDNTTTKRNMDRQYNKQNKHARNMEYCLSMFLLVVVLSVHISFGRCIVCPCFFWSLYCLSMFLLEVVLSVHVSFDNTTTKINMQETWTGNTTTKRNMDRQYNDQKKHGQAIQRPKETWTDNTTTKRIKILKF